MGLKNEVDPKRVGLKIPRRLRVHPQRLRCCVDANEHMHHGLDTWRRPRIWTTEDKSQLPMVDSLSWFELMSNPLDQ
jgi:hypothetical protein